jgi:outer membrane immunogenic protein
MRRNLMLLAAAAIGLSASVASAADLPRKAYAPPAPLPPPPSWTGFYLGLNGGWGWAKTEATIAQTGDGGLLDFAPVAVSRTANGAVFGGQLGYNWQIAPNWVLGVEGDFDGTGMSRSGSAVFPSILAPGAGRNDAFSADARIQWLATVRGRVGYTWGPGLVYITGGGAWEKREANVLVSSNLAAGVFGTSATGTFSNTKGGWTLGGGYEYMLTPNWIARAEYLYYSFQSDNTLGLSFPGPCAGATTCGVNVTSSNNNISVVRAGLSYKF